jgi:nitroreductase
MKDKYQKRYEAHQKRKKKLIDLLNSRASQRIFNGEEIEDWKCEFLLESMAKVPSSCGRQAVFGKIISDRTEKELLGALLVGGVGWIHRADKIILLYADPQAYKAGNEISYMPYLDAGAVLATAYLLCEDMRIGCCFVNPNVRDKNKELFANNFNRYGIFCGALAIGNYDKKAKVLPKKKSIIIK